MSTGHTTRAGRARVGRWLLAAWLPLASCAQGNGEAGAPPTATGTAAVAHAPSATATASASASASAPAPPPPPPLRLAEEGPVQVIDMHVDTPWKVHFKGRDKRLKKGHATPDKIRRGHYAGIVYPIYIPDYIHNSHPRIADADEILATIDELVAEHDLLTPAFAGAPAEPQKIPAGEVAVFVSIEGAGAFAEDIEQIDRFIARGVRLVGLCHARDNDLASSATGKKGKKGSYGLTELGKKIAARIYAAGALVDVSHMSDASFADLVPIAREHHAPIVATHSNARALADHNRNLTDEQLRIIAETGGVAGLNLHRRYVSRRGKVRMKDAVDQVMHMVEVAGVDHVAIGTDFDGGSPVSALDDAAQLPALADALQTAGLSDAQVRNIFGENARRVLYWTPPTGG